MATAATHDSARDVARGAKNASRNNASRRPRLGGLNGGMQIERFDPEADTAQTRACYQAYAASAPVDDPHCPPMSLQIFTGWLACGWTEDHPEVWFAGDSLDEADGCYTATMPLRENRHLAHVYPQVPPARRRAGIGTALLRHAAARAADQGRATLTAEVRDGSAGQAFAQALGARRGVTEVRRLLDLAAVPAGTLARLRAEADRAAHGYLLLSWEGTVPEEYFGQVAVVNAALADAPIDAGTQAQSWDADRVRAGQRRVELLGIRRYTLVARCTSSGDFAGLTELSIDPETPDWGIQELTAVTRPHRGHRLGLLLKAAMLDLLAEREPQLRWVVTCNAEGNSHMIAINAKLGYRVLDSGTSWQLNVADVLARPVRR
jgi:GNAT superfamily N-acetyltransferase/RimJ/RimL family protein N-acetyltransferase